MGLLELLTVKGLREEGIPLKSVRRAVEVLRGLTGQDRPLARLVLVIDGNDITLRDGDDGMVSALRWPTQRVMTFPIGPEHAKLLAEIEAESEDTVTATAP